MKISISLLGLWLCASASMHAEYVAVTKDFKVTVENRTINTPGYSWQNMVFQSVSQSDGTVLREFTLEGEDDGYSDQSYGCTGIVVCRGQVFFCGWDRYFGVGVPPTVIVDGFIFGTANGVDLQGKVISDEYIRGMATDGEILVVAGENGFIATSTDAASTWTDFKIGGTRDDYERVEYSNGKFYAINAVSLDNYRSYAVSADGLSWEHRTGTINLDEEPIRVHKQPSSGYLIQGSETLISLDASSNSSDFNIQWHVEEEPISNSNQSDLALAEDWANQEIYAVLSNSDGSISTDKVSVLKVESIDEKVNIGKSLYGTGANDEGQLGIGNKVDQTRYQFVRDDIIQMSGGGEFSAFITQDHQLYATGMNQYGQLGIGNTVSSSSPVHVADDVIFVDCGTNHMLYIDKHFTLWGVGLNSHYQLGFNVKGYITNPTEIARHVISAAAGETSTYFIRQDHKLFAIGRHQYGALGLGFPFEAIHVPVCVDNHVASVTAGMHNLTYTKLDGTTWVAGQNHKGQFGNGSRDNSLGVKKLANHTQSNASGMAHILYLNDDFELFATGFNFAGAIGNGTTQDRLRPYLTARSVASVSSDPGSAATHYINHSGNLYAMGFNQTGTLGDGTQVNRTSPVYINNQVVDVDSGTIHTLILKQPQTATQPPAFLFTPRSTFVEPGVTLQLEPIILGSTSTLQWFHNEAPLVNETGSTLSIENVSADHGGVYRLEATGANGNVVSTEFISVYVRNSNGQISPWTPSAPDIVFLEQPQSHAFELGEDYTLSAVINPATNAQFQWFKDGDLIPGATEATLHFQNLRALDAGDYHVVVSHPRGELVSVTATLTLITTSSEGNLEIQRLTDSLQLMMKVQMEQSYVLEESSNLTDWQTVDSFTAEQQTRSISIPLSRSQTFYRLRPVESNQ